MKAWTINAARFYSEVEVIHSFTYKGEKHYVIVVREEPDIILQLRQDGNIFWEDPTKKKGD